MKLVSAFSTARGVSEFGNAFRAFAIPIAVFAITKDKILISKVQLFLTVGAILGSIITGSMIDRFNKVFALIFADILSLLFTLTVGFGILTSKVEFIFIGVFFISLLASFHSAALDSSTADFLEKDGLNIFHGFSTQQLLIVIFAIVGGYSSAYLVDIIPLWTFIIVDAITFLFSSIWILFLVKKYHNESIVITSKEKSSFLKNLVSDWKDGFTESISNTEALKHIGVQFILGICFGLFMGGIDSHLLITLNWSQEMFGIFGPTNKISYVLGSILTYGFSKNATLKKLCFWGTILMLIGYVGLPFSTGAVFLFAFFGIQQVGSSFINAANKTLVMKNVNSEYRGRVSAFRKLTIDIGLFLGNFCALYLLNFSTSAPLILIALLSAVSPFILLTIKNWPSRD